MSLDSENWQLLQELFHLAEATPVADRERILAAKCPDERLLRRALELVGAVAVEDAPEPEPPASHLSGKIGPYSLIRHLGTGGIGSVYLVERMTGGAVQRSALKVLAPHSVGPAFVERFHREQHILGSLDHPNITRMLDAGLTGNGQPYLVMEYVDGTHLDTYCDERKLGINERLQLFLRVCDAVAYAHRNLIVHLDLKPSNILVAREGANPRESGNQGTVKLLDFGTSKLIEPDSRLTTTVMATPAYASPEQLRSEPVTTACDIYALGAILFELLAGRRFGESASAAAMIERAFREEEPEKPADAVTPITAELRNTTAQKLRQLLSGDLGTIVRKCLSPRPRDRYPSMDALIDDLQRYIDGRPVLARPQTILYQAGKFVRRHRGAVAASIVATVALLGSLAYAEWRQQQALRDGQRALRMQTFMTHLFRMANSDYTGKPAATVPELLDLGVKRLPEFITDPNDLRAAQMSLAEAMNENGDIDSAQKVFAQTIASSRAVGDNDTLAESEAYSGNISYQLGDVDQGAKLTADALALSRKPGVSPAARVWSEVYYAYDRENMGFRSDENLQLLRDAVKKTREFNLPAQDAADVIDDLAQDLEVRGQLDEAESAFRQALEVYGRDPLDVCEQSGVYGELAHIDEMRGNVEAGLPLYQRAIDGYTSCAGADSRGAVNEIDYYAGALIKLGRAKEAVPLLEAALPMWRKIAANSPDLSEVLYFLSQAYIKTGRFAEGEKMAEELVACQEGKVSPTDRRMGASHLLWAEALAGLGRYKDALPHAEIADKLLAMNAISAGAKAMEAEAHQTLVDVQARLR